MTEPLLFGDVMRQLGLDAEERMPQIIEMARRWAALGDQIAALQVERDGLAHEISELAYPALEAFVRDAWNTIERTPAAMAHVLRYIGMSPDGPEMYESLQQKLPHFPRLLTGILVSAIFGAVDTAAAIDEDETPRIDLLVQCDDFMAADEDHWAVVRAISVAVGMGEAAEAAALAVINERLRALPRPARAFRRADQIIIEPEREPDSEEDVS